MNIVKLKKKLNKKCSDNAVPILQLASRYADALLVAHMYGDKDISQEMKERNIQNLRDIENKMVDRLNDFCEMV